MYSLEELKVENDKLTALLANPEQGTMIWNILLVQSLNNIVSMATEGAKANEPNVQSQIDAGWPKTKYRMNIIFGEHFSRVARELLDAHNVADGDMAEIQSARDKLIDTDFCIERIEFDTEEEMAAYCQGRNDMDGWNDCMDVDETELPILQSILDNTHERNERGADMVD
jgi:hypothetical protein